jgi:hypothetical protein
MNEILFINNVIIILVNQAPCRYGSSGRYTAKFRSLKGWSTICLSILNMWFTIFVGGGRLERGGGGVSSL